MSASQVIRFDASLTATHHGGGTPTITIVKKGTTYVEGEQVFAYGNNTVIPITVTTVDQFGGITEVTNIPNPSSGTVDYKITTGSGRLNETRDTSDVTRSIKERSIYNEFKASSTILNSPKMTRMSTADTINSGASGTLWLQQSNQFRLSYLFGRTKCTICPTSFNENGVRNFTVNGVQEGS